MAARKLVLLAVLIMIVAIAGCSQSQAPKETPSVTPSPTPSGGAPGFGGIPTYAGSKLYSAPTFYYQMLGLPEGVTVKTYQVKSGSVRDILEWYKSQLSDYEIVQDITLLTMNTPQGSMDYGVLIMKKGNEGVGIWAMSGAGMEGVVYFVATGPAETLSGTSSESSGGYTGEGLPSQDIVSGEEPVERYPGSVMLYYSYDDSDPLRPVIDIDYGTRDSPEKVFQWYRNEMVAKGWKLEDQYSDEFSLSLYFTRKGDELDVYIEKPSEDTPYTTISVKCILTRLPSQDIASGEDPFERYPGSVMLRHSILNSGGKTVVSATYGTMDDVQRVYNWYTDQLKNEGWNIQVAGSQNGEFTIMANKNGDTLTILISKVRDTYTEVSVTYAH